MDAMLEMETRGDPSMVDLDAAAEQCRSFYSPDQSSFTRQRFKLSSPVAVGEDAGALPMKQLFAAAGGSITPGGSIPALGSSSSFSSNSSLGPEPERSTPMDRHRWETGLVLDTQSFRPQNLIPDVVMSPMGNHQVPFGALTQQTPFRFNCEAGDNFGKISPREHRERASPLDSPPECPPGERKRESGEVGQSDDASKLNTNQGQDIISVIASSLSHLNFMQQNGVNNGNPEFSPDLKLTLGSMSMAQHRQTPQPLHDEAYMRSNAQQSTLLLHPSWDSASQRQLDHRQQFINQLLLSRAGQLLPSVNNDLAAAGTKSQLSAPRPLPQAFPTPKSTSAMWLSEEPVNGCGMLNLHQNQQSTRFDAHKFPVMNQDFLEILRAPERLTKESCLLSSLSLDQIVPNLMSPGQSSGIHLGLQLDHFSRKVFIGGLPPDIAEEEITQAFRQFGPLVVDWPYKAESKSYFPPKGYCFLLFQDEMSVQALISSCVKDDGKLYWSVSSPTIKDKPVQIRPWNLSDSDFVMDGSQPLDPRKTIFVGGVPRPLRAVELAVAMNRLYGGVCYAGIDTDPELKYPKGAGRVAFSNQQSYIAAISARFVQLQHSDIDKRVEVKPYVLDDQLCDECQGTRCGGQFASYFCANVACLQYYCEHCWSHIHARPGREFHKPLVKEGSDRPRNLPFRWC